MQWITFLTHDLRPFSTILVAAKASLERDQLITYLADRGVNILGPVDSARMALALAAQAGADLAIVGPTLTGRRGGAELAEQLTGAWGMEAVIAPSALA